MPSSLKPKPSISVTQRIQYGIVRLLAGIVRLLPVPLVEWIAGILGTLVYLGLREHRRRAMHNLELAFPEKSLTERRRIAHASARHFARVAAEVLINPQHCRPETYREFLTSAEASEPVMDQLREGRAIVITGHIGNWELLGFFVAMRGAPMTAIARSLGNPLIDNWLAELRGAAGLKIIDKDGAAAQADAILEAGGVIGIVPDQNAGKQGIFVPFFGRLAASHKSIALLAMRHEVPIVCGCCHRVGSGYRFISSHTEIIEPKDWAGQDDPLFYITARWVRAVEKMARTYPEQYLWLHRRWKYRPPHEFYGKPMPMRMFQKIAALPWIKPEDFTKF